MQYSINDSKYKVLSNIKDIALTNYELSKQALLGQVRVAGEFADGKCTEKL